MPLAAGSQLGPYQILAPLGAGGMGEVYKARDTHLGREVAIKTIASKRMGNEERKRRFLQEARTASALNHPGIVTIYDISRSGEIDYIVMEYVRGRTLESMIAQHRIGMQESICYALQIADALARAHAAGVIHRDLKPGNIMITDGMAKILDFGLAKLGNSEEDSDEIVEDDPTRTVRMPESPSTLEGVVIGTAAYMSPEQAEGKKVDARSDIFSFGAVLYEMVTGLRSFSGESSASTMAAVIKSEPKPPSQLVEGIPRDLERIILRCLRKDPARRFQHATDLRVDLEELKETSESGEAVVAAPVPGKTRNSVWITAFIALVAVVGAVWLWRSRSEAAEPQYEPVPLTTFDGVERSPSFSPDGTQVVFSWNGEKQDNYDLYAMNVGSGAPVRLTTNPAPDVAPAWSPDNRWIAFLRLKQGIFLIPPIGGNERKVADWPGGCGCQMSLSWSPDGKYLAFGQTRQGSEPAGIFIIPAQGGPAKRITRSDSFDNTVPAFSPDGHGLAFADCVNDTACGVSLVDLDEAFEARRPPRRIADSSAFIRSISWAADGESLLIGQSTTGPDTYRLARLSVKGKSQPQRLGFASAGASDASLSRTGSRLAYAQYHTDSDIFAIRDGSMSRSPLSSTRGDTNPQYSPDGLRVALSSYRSGSQEVWVAGADGSNAMQLTTSRASGTPRWSPDGRRIVFDTQRADGRWGIRVVDASGGQPAQVVREEANDKVPSFSWDGKWIYFSSDRTGRDEIYRVPSEGGEAVKVTDNGGYVAFESIDRKSVYYTKEAGGCNPLFVRSLAGGPERQVTGSACNRSLVVSERGIYFISDMTSREYAVQLLDPVTGKATVLWKISRLYLNQGLGISPDGKTILISAATQSGADLMLVEGFR